MNDPTVQRQLSQLQQRNAQLADALQKSRDRLAQMAADLAALSEPTSTYGTLIAVNGAQGTAASRTAEIFSNGRQLRVAVLPNIADTDLRVGAQVRLGEGQVVVEAHPPQATGALGTVTALLNAGDAVKATPARVQVATASGEQVVLTLADALRTSPSLRSGDQVLYDPKAHIALEVVARAEIATLGLEEVPDVTFGDIGGLAEEIALIRDSVELPFAHPELYASFDLRPPKGVLLYGPPGCGKTLIAKAIANSLARALGDGDGGDDTAGSGAAAGRSFFLNVKGPELLNKFVGETERHIRLIFERARELAASNPGRPVVVFFDEMESIFRTRGTGVSSDMETTVVPQLLTELDGVEDLRNVIIIGATNREELIDPAILRPGRLDIKIHVGRPDRAAAAEIFARHFTTTVPCAGDREALIAGAVEQLFADDPLVRLHYSGGGPAGEAATLHLRDFVSGALIANVMDRAKKLAIKDAIATGLAPALGAAHLAAAIAAERLETVPRGTGDLTDWVRIAGVGDGGIGKHRAAGNIVDVEIVREQA